MVELLLHFTAFTLALGTTQPPTRWVQGTLSTGVKQPGREAGHSPSSSPEIKNDRTIPLLDSVQTVSGDQAAFYTMGTGDSFSRGKAAGT
jgi:hypothetical protein